MTNDKELNLMNDVVNTITSIVQNRLNSRTEALEAIASSSGDVVPESILKMREEEAAKIRAVAQEQREILAIIKSVYPQTNSK
jgi:hypothetical protein